MKLYGITRIGPKGQIVIPQEGRQDLGLKPGDKVVVFSTSEKGIIIAPTSELKKHLNKFSELFDSEEEYVTN